MKIVWQYILRFWYVADNWDLGMAFFMLYDNIRGSLKYGSGTFAPVELNQLTIAGGNTINSSRYEAVSYYMLENLFSAFKKLSPQTSIVDIGCGKGRMMMVAAHFGFTDIKGVDFAKELCDQARVNMKKKSIKFPALSWNVLNENVENYNISENDSVFFLFNPFNEIILKKFLDKVDASCVQHPRTIYFFYASPEHRDLLLNNGYAIVYQKKKLHLESIIAVRDDS